MSNDLATLLARLRALKPELAARFGVSAIQVFGSRARGQEAPDSDLDLLVDFAPGARPTTTKTRPQLAAKLKPCGYGGA